jgi:N-acylneuraminate cytidylyltransferase
MKIIIPARLGSKGLPFKNRTLFDRTASIIPQAKRNSTWVTTDDPEIEAQAVDWGFNVIRRPAELSQDESSIRDVMLHAVRHLNLDSRELVLMLYLTYPERTWADVEAATEFFLQYYQYGATDSLLCKKAVKSHPYLCLEETGIGSAFGKQITPHDLYRRQDYPTCFELSHYISIFEAGAIYRLNRNLYSNNTVFYGIGDPVDIDTQKDLESLNERSN